VEEYVQNEGKRKWKCFAGIFLFIKPGERIEMDVRWETSNGDNNTKWKN